MVYNEKTFNGTGSDCSGSNGAKDRVLTLSNTGLTKQDGLLVYAAGLALSLSVDYTITHKASGTTITFLNRLWNNMTVVVKYYESTDTAGTGVAGELIGDINDILTYGNQFRFKYFDLSYGAGSYYDDDISLTQSGNDSWCSGLIYRVDNKQGSEDAALIERGKVAINDSKVYVNGSVQTSGLANIKIGENNPVEREYELIYNTPWSVNGSDIYKKCYIRYLPNGSLIGE